jgi:phosphatidylglycerol:prolipoprotein diacylglycerol transferase
VYPEIRIGSDIVIPTYFLTISLVYCLCIYWVVVRARRQDLNRTDALDLSLAIMLGGFAGSRLLHVVFENPEYYLSDWLRVFYFWQGGFVFYGGMIGAALAALWLVRRREMILPLWLDFFAPIFAGGYALGRVSCFLAGCCYGRACDYPWGMVDHALGDLIVRHPTQLYAVLWESATLCTLFNIERCRKKPDSQEGSFVFHLMKQQGALFSLWLVLHGLGRIIMEHYRDDFRGSEIFGLSISTWISFAVIAIGLAGLIRLSKKMAAAI